jgi:ethanolamine ammonia-lyase small subunit
MKQELAVEEVIAELNGINLPILTLSTQALSRADLIERPAFAAELDLQSQGVLTGAAAAAGAFVSVIIEDGFSPAAVRRHAAPIIKELLRQSVPQGFRYTPVCVVKNAHLDISQKIASRWPVNWAVVIQGARPSLRCHLDVQVHFYDMVFGEDLQDTFSLSPGKEGYAQMAENLMACVRRESARLPVPVV